jgi:hypothetical protein
MEVIGKKKVQCPGGETGRGAESGSARRDASQILQNYQKILTYFRIDIIFGDLAILA